MGCLLVRCGFVRKSFPRLCTVPPGGACSIAEQSLRDGGLFHALRDLVNEFRDQWLGQDFLEIEADESVVCGRLLV